MPRARLLPGLTALTLVGALASGGALAQEQEGEDAPAEETAEQEPVEVSVFGRPLEVKRAAGSAHRIDEEELERFEDDDVHKTLQRVPGVYVRGEDGYGLRPNIGLRGASSDRSKKVTLMEDGVLLAPAPYAAPAAYYFPLSTRMYAVEVFKGPSSLRYGPNTIGGAINMVSRPIGYGHEIGADLALGSELYGKGHGHYSYGTDHWGVLVEAVRLRSDGFKELDAPPRYGESPDTGFDKLELVAKARVNTAPVAAVYNEGNVKVSWGRETSNETYLGLSDADFRATPLRRYAASQRDRMEWDRTAVELSHVLVVRESALSDTLLTLRTTAYRHDFHRVWSKLDAFDGGPALLDILRDPTSTRALYYQVLTGTSQDELGVDDPLLIGRNDRTFVSQGIQTSGALRLPELGPFSQRLRFGLRLHYDEAKRFHTATRWRMRGGEMVDTGAPVEVTTDNTGSATALAAHLLDEIAFHRFLLSPGVRFEHVLTDFEDRLANEQVAGRQVAFLPGVSAIYQIIEELAVLAGVHQGFSPVSPGQPANVLPEVALNYEGGARFEWEWLGAEAIGFFSDYSNLSGECTFSSGCRQEQLDAQFNGGEAFIYGLEASARADVPTPVELTVPLTAAYTFTRTEFRSAFTSDNPLWGDVQAGDELPYVPQHQLAATAGIDSDEYGGIAVGATYVGEMLEQAGAGGPLAGVTTDAYVVFDATAHYQLLDELQLYVKMENIADEHAIVARRPFGARPNRPRFFYGGVKVEIDRP